MDHLQENHSTSKGIIIGGMRLASRLVDDALRKKKERVAKAVARDRKKTTQTPQGEFKSSGGPTNSQRRKSFQSLRQDSVTQIKQMMKNCLMPIDFDIGKEIGDPELREEGKKTHGVVV